MEITVRRSERLTHRLARPLNMSNEPWKSESDARIAALEVSLEVTSEELDTLKSESESLALALEAACVALQNNSIVAPYEGFMEREIKQAQEARNRWREKHPHRI